MKRLIISFVILTNLTFAQQIIYLDSFGKFGLANSLDIDLNKNFYVSDILENTISKLDSNGIEIIKIGGLGWGNDSFDEPVDLYTNTLSLYVADKNNNRILRFDKDLNFISEFLGNNNKNNIEFGYPISVGISDIGDLFILDSDNKRILKFNLNGDFISEIGGNDAGIYAISNPIYFTLDKLSNIYILDESTIIIFDQYGNNILKFIPEITPLSLEISDNILILINSSRITFYDLKVRKIIADFNGLPNIDEDEKIKSAKLIKNILFVLTTERIIKYQITN